MAYRYIWLPPQWPPKAKAGDTVHVVFDFGDGIEVTPVAKICREKAQSTKF